MIIIRLTVQNRFKEENGKDVAQMSQTRSDLSLFCSIYQLVLY